MFKKMALKNISYTWCRHAKLSMRRVKVASNSPHAPFLLPKLVEVVSNEIATINSVKVYSATRSQIAFILPLPVSEVNFGILRVFQLLVW